MEIDHKLSFYLEIMWLCTINGLTLIWFIITYIYALLIIEYCQIKILQLRIYEYGAFIVYCVLSITSFREISTVLLFIICNTQFNLKLSGNHHMNMLRIFKLEEILWKHIQFKLMFWLESNNHTPISTYLVSQFQPYVKKNPNTSRLWMNLK